MPHETEIVIRGARQPVRFGEPDAAKHEPHTHSKILVWHVAAALVLVGFLAGLAL